MIPRRAPALLYGIAALAVSVGALLWASPSARALLWAPPPPPPPEGGTARAATLDVLLVALFGLQHSVMARPWFKGAYARLFPAATERMTYTLVSCVGTALVFRLWQPLPGTAWSLESGLLTMLGAAGWLLLGVTFVWMNAGELLGSEQIVAYGKGQPDASPRFRTPGPYRAIRHPLMAGMLLGLWGASTMTWSRLIFAVSMSAYIILGILLEERDLSVEFGRDYREYRRRVPMLVPRLRPARARRTV